MEDNNTWLETTFTHLNEKSVVKFDTVCFTDSGNLYQLTLESKIDELITIFRNIFTTAKNGKLVQVEKTLYFLNDDTEWNLLENSVITAIAYKIATK